MSGAIDYLLKKGGVDSSSGTETSFGPHGQESRLALKILRATEHSNVGSRSRKVLGYIYQESVYLDSISGFAYAGVYVQKTVYRK